MHQYLGLLCIGWGLIVGMTGTSLALNPIFTKYFQTSILKHLSEKYSNQHESSKPNVSLKAVIDSAFKAKPNGVIWYIIFPGVERGIQNHYLVLMHGTGSISKYFNEYLMINSKSAKLKEIIRLPLLMQFALISTPFHFVNYGGILAKMIWAMFAVFTLCVAFLGIFMTYYRKKIMYLRKI
jgi:uncharacterized iron-regulated membrane protein